MCDEPLTRHLYRIVYLGIEDTARHLESSTGRRLHHLHESVHQETMTKRSVTQQPVFAAVEDSPVYRGEIGLGGRIEMPKTFRNRPSPRRGRPQQLIFRKALDQDAGAALRLLELPQVVSQFDVESF